MIGGETYLLKRGPRTARWMTAVAHLARFDPVTGEIVGKLCSTPVHCDISSNVPWGLRTCKHCLRARRRQRR